MTWPRRSAHRWTPWSRPSRSLEGYKAAGFAEGYEAYGAYSYDAANATINALKVSLKDAADAKSAREATITAMASATVVADGATGKRC